VFHTPLTNIGGGTSDGLICTQDNCDNGLTVHINYITDDNNPCTADGCLEPNGIFHTPLTNTGGGSSDGLVCTSDDCDNGVTVHNAITYYDGNPCTTDGCTEPNGVFHSALTNMGGGTSDGLVCTSDDCDNGVTVNNAVPTDDGNACTTDGCAEPTGVYHTPVNIDDFNPCTKDACNPLTGVITHTDTCSLTVNIKMFIEGYYSGGGIMANAYFPPFGGLLYHVGLSLDPTDADYVTVSLMNSSAPYGLVASATGILKTNGNLTVTIGAPAQSGTAYYIKVNHRNSIETWSAAPVMMSSVTSYDFSSAVTQAYDNNPLDIFSPMADLGDGNWGIFSGDISEYSTATVGIQDGIVESQDYGDMENAVYYSPLGYLVEDITGDGIVESADYGLMETNVYFTRIVNKP
jgi:hypothetical protein